MQKETRGTRRMFRSTGAALLLMGCLGAGVPGWADRGSRPAVGAALDPSPLAPPLRLTATFGEYRAGHLHAGVDLSTGGTTGLPVRVGSRGSVVRLRASGSGYGKAIYLAADAGRTLLYAHLSRFSPALEAFVLQAQHASGEYEVDLYPEPGRFRFSAGDTIAWSGASGAGPPHLHFELRDGDHALNPLPGALTAPDDVAPTVGPAYLHALGVEARVADGPGAALTRGDAAALRVWGRVGVECRVIDRAQTTDARLAPLALRLFLDDKLCFARTFREFSVMPSADVERVYGWELGEEGKWSYRMYRWPLGSPADPTEELGGDGVIDVARVPLGEHRLCVEAVDAAGNVSEGVWRIDVRPPLCPTLWKAAPAPGGGWLLAMRLEVPVDSLRLPLRLQLAVDEARTGKPQPGRRAGADSNAVISGHEAWQDAGEWLRLGDGWLAAYTARGGPVRIVDHDGVPILPALHVGTWPNLPWSAIPPVVHVDHTEDFTTIEVESRGGFPGLPQASLVACDGSRIPLRLRGCGSRGGWLFAVEPGALVGETSRLKIEFPRAHDRIDLPLGNLIGLPVQPDPHEAVTETALRLADGRLTLLGTAGAVMGAAILSVTWVPARGAVWEEPAEQQGLLPLSPILRIAPQGWPLGGPLALRMGEAAGLDRMGIARGKWGLFHRKGGGAWRWVGQETTRDGVGATITALGDFVILEDCIAPRILSPVPEDGTQLTGSPPRLVVRVTDVGSGFEARAANISLDGEALLAVWDVDEGTLSVGLDTVLASGRHTWAVQVTDRLGNRTEEKYTFSIQPR